MREDRREYYRQYYREHREDRLRYCKKYRQEHKEQIREYRLNHKEQIREQIKRCKERVIKLSNNIKQNMGCSMCGETNPTRLVFHHVNPTNKKCGVFECRSINALLEEANKCIVLCRNCHRKVHSKKGESQEGLRISPVN